MNKGNRDFNNILKCLSCDIDGITLVKEDESYLRSLLPFIKEMKPTIKRPDGFAEIQSTAFVLEHFQFDNSKITRKGSVQNQTAAKTDRKLDKLLIGNEDVAVVNENVSKNGLYYIENFKKQFLSHAKNIESYKKDIQTETHNNYEKYIIGFVIEDASPLGSIYYDNGLKCVDLVYSKEFLDLFETTKNLDFVIFAMTGNEENRILSFISRNTINHHRENQVEVSKIQRFLFENTICASAQIMLPIRQK